MAKESNNYISLQEAVKYCPYSQEYLSLRARQGKLKAVKFGRNWVTKKEWLEEYLKSVEEYNNNFKAKKIAVPPKNLPIANYQSGLPSIKSPASLVRFGFIVALVFVLAAAGCVFGKESFKNVYRELNPIVIEFNENFTTLASEFDFHFTTLVSEFNENFDKGMIGLAKDVSSYTYIVGGAGDIIIEKTIEVAADTIADIPQSLTTVSLTTASIGDTFKEYGQWLTKSTSEWFTHQTFVLRQEIKKVSQKIVQNYTAANNFVEQKLGGFSSQTEEIAIGISNIPGTFSEGYFVANDFLEKKISQTQGRLVGGAKSINEGIKFQSQRIAGTITKTFKAAYRFITQPWRLLPEKIVEKVGIEEIEELKTEIEKLKKEPVIVKEVEKVTEVTKITKVEPIKEITKETIITKIDEEELTQLKAQIAEINLWGTDIENLKNITQKLQAHPTNVTAPTAPIYIASQGLQVGGAGIFASLGVSGSAGMGNLGVGGSVSLGTDPNDVLTVAATSTFEAPLTAKGGFTAGTDTLTIDTLGNLSTTGNITTTGTGNLTVAGDLSVAGTQTFTGATTFSVAPVLSSDTIITGTDSRTITFPTTADLTLATLTGTEALTNKTYEGLTISTTTGTLTIPAAIIEFSGDNDLTFTTTGPTSLTLPAVTDTLAVLGTAQTFTATQTFATATATDDTLVLSPATGGVASFSGTITSDDLTTPAKTWTFPDATGTVTLLGNTTTGSGSIVLATSPTLTTPDIGAATATSINKVAITAPDTLATLTIADGKTLTVNNTMTLAAGADGQTWTFPATGGTVTVLGNTVTGSGNIVLATSPTFATSITTPLVYGSLAASGNLTLRSTSDGTKGYVILADDGGSVGIGTTGPTQKLDIRGNLLTSPMADTVVDCDGSDSADPGTCEDISEDDALVAVESADKLCTDSINSPTCVYTDSGGDCDATDGDAHTYIRGSDCGTDSDTAVDSSWAFKDTGATPDAYDLGEDLYIDNSPTTNFNTVTGYTYIGNWIAKPLSATELGMYDSGNNPVVVFDELASPIIWEQTLSSQFDQGSFEQTTTSDDRVYLEKDENGNYYSNGIFTSSAYDYSGEGDFIQFRATTKLPSSTTITAQVQVSDDNFSTIKDSITLELVNDTYTYDISSLANAKSVRVKFDFQTEDVSLTPVLIHFEVWANLIEGDTDNASPELDSTGSSQLVDGLLDDGNSLIQKVKQALASLGLFIENGIAQVQELIAEKITSKEVRTEKLCVEDICVDRNQLKELLEKNSASGSEQNCQPAAEICDGIDNDCDGLVDEDNVCQAECQAQTFYYDGDGDGFGNYGNFVSVCEAPPGYVSDNTDCDDGDASINPAATEICNDGIDNECDSKVDTDDEDCQTAPPTNNPPLADDQSITTDEDTPVTITLTASDEDGDALTYTIVSQPTNGTLSGEAPNLTYTPNTDYNGQDTFTFKVNDGTADGNEATITITINPTCEKQTFFSDSDSDNYGDPNNSTSACEVPPDYVLDNTDCNDSDPDINPGATEVCDGIDNNCDGNVDENVDCGTTSCDASLNLAGECQNSCLEGSCQTCTPECQCAAGWSDCDLDLPGCETEGECQ